MKLEQYRKEIDQIDEEMKKLFIKRMHLAKEVGAYKRQNNLAVVDLKREQDIIEKSKETFIDSTLWPQYERFLRFVITLSKEMQT